LPGSLPAGSRLKINNRHRHDNQRNQEYPGMQFESICVIEKYGKMQFNLHGLM